MVRQIIVAVVAAYCAFIATDAARAQQSQQSIQQQEAAADSQLSASGTATYSTPYKLFQAYYAGVTGTSTAAMYACFTSKALNSAFEGNPPATPDGFAAMDAANLQRAPQGYVLRAFMFTADPKSPKITASFTFTVKNPQNPAQPLTIPATDTLTLIDTGSGWMIDVYEEH